MKQQMDLLQICFCLFHLVQICFYIYDYELNIIHTKKITLTNQ